MRSMSLVRKRNTFTDGLSLLRRRPFDLIIILSSSSYSFVIIIIISTVWVWIHWSSAYTHYLLVILPFELIFQSFQIIIILHLFSCFLIRSIDRPDRLSLFSSLLSSFFSLLFCFILRYTSKFYWKNVNRFRFLSSLLFGIHFNDRVLVKTIDYLFDFDCRYSIRLLLSSIQLDHIQTVHMFRRVSFLSITLFDEPYELVCTCCVIFENHQAHSVHTFHQTSLQLVR